MVIISDSSPIIHLARIGKLEILPKLFGKIILAESVFRELVEGGSDMPGSLEISTANWVEIRACANQAFKQKLEIDLDSGEAESIALAVELQPDWLIMDETNGRAVAKTLHINVIGLLGLLLRAKEAGIFHEIRPILDDLSSRAGFWISRKIYLELLRLAGE